MLLHVIRKMINNRWMSLFLTAGFILAVAIVSSIPIYTGGILQRMLQSELEQYQKETNIFPGFYTVKSDISSLEKNEITDSFRNLKNNVYNRLVKDIPLPVLSVSEQIVLNNFNITPELPQLKPSSVKLVKLITQPDFEKHIRITGGRLYSGPIKDETAEIIVRENFLNTNNLFLNDIVDISGGSNGVFSKMKIVGIFEPADYQDTYWKTFPASDQCYMDFSVFENEILGKNIPLIKSAEWNFALDYHRIRVDSLSPIIGTMENQLKLASSYRSLLNINFPAKDILDNYKVRERQLRLTLWIIEVPVLILVFFFIFMITNLIITSEQNEISVLQSRGKSRAQIFLLYLIQGSVLGIISLAAGPPLGLYICKFMGASNGFLEFVRRAPLSAGLTWTAYLYSLIAVFFLMATMLVPAFLSSKISIVQAKQKQNRDSRPPVWKKFFIDIVLVVFSAYGFYRYRNQQSILRMTGVSTADIGIDPLLFLTSTLFILGAGLLFLRIYPLLIRLVYKTGKKHWGAQMYCALLQIGRTGRKGQFFMLFLVFSIAIGIFSANMARTLNRNIEDRIRYETGADITLLQDWASDADIVLDSTSGYGEETRVLSSVTYYREPSFIPFTRLEGVEKATKVFREDEGQVMINGRLVTDVTIQGIIPNEFGEIAWFRSDLLPYHWFNYLNFLSEAENSFLLSGNFLELNNISPGDTISLSWGGQDFLDGQVCGFVDFWPSFNPYNEENKFLVVANLQYLHNKMAREPYQVWLKKAENSTDELVYSSLQENIADISEIKSASQELIRYKNDPLLKGINGALTQGFILITIICLTGFLIYWMLSLKNRTLQFGILRAIGLPRRKVTTILLLEQLLMSGIAVLAGILAGSAASSLFVPFLQLVFSAAEQVPPFKVISLRSDYIKIYIIIVVMLTGGLFSLRTFLKKLKIGSALKLGED